MAGEDHFESPFLRKEDSVLVIIDMQEKLFPAMAEKERLLQNVLRLVRFSRLMDIPVVLTEQEKLGATLPGIRSELKAVEPIGKINFDCFCAQEFVERLRDLGRGALVLAGIEAHICVAQTALHAVSDHVVHVVSDAIASRSPHNREVAIQRMIQSGAIITSTEMMIYELLGKAGTDTFREVLKLVK